MQKITLTLGIPSSGKSTWAKEQVAANPTQIVRVNRDDLRTSLHNYHFSKGNEAIVVSTRNFIIKKALIAGKDVIVDETNLNNKNKSDIIKLAKSLNIDCTITEKPFYIDLDEAIFRDSLRLGSAKVGEAVVRNFWKLSGGEKFKNYQSSTITLSKQKVEKVIQDDSKQHAIIVDLDGSVCDISHRNPYDAAECNYDKPVQHVVNLIKMFDARGVKIIFCSGREDKYYDLSSEWLDKHVGVNYSLYMRPSGNIEKDSIIKKNIFDTHIKDKYFIEAIIDDRLQVCQLWHELNLPLFRVGPPDASF